MLRAAGAMAAAKRGVQHAARSRVDHDTQQTDKAAAPQRNSGDAPEDHFLGEARERGVEDGARGEGLEHEVARRGRVQTVVVHLRILNSNRRARLEIVATTSHQAADENAEQERQGKEAITMQIAGRSKPASRIRRSFPTFWNPRRRVVSSRSMGNEVPAMAPVPSGFSSATSYARFRLREQGHRPASEVHEARLKKMNSTVMVQKGRQDTAHNTKDTTNWLTKAAHRSRSRIMTAA